MFERLGVGEEVGRHVLQDRLLPEVEADHLRDVVVDRLVVGDARPDRVGDRDVARPVGADQARDAEQRVRAELQRIDEVVIEAAVHGVDALQAARRAHVEHVVADDEVGRLDELDAHLAGEERVLEVGGVQRARQGEAGLADGLELHHSRCQDHLRRSDEDGCLPVIQRSPSPSQRFASGPSLSPRRGEPDGGSNIPLLGEREGPAAKPWEGEGEHRQSLPRTDGAFE